jgi:bisphosphoglycerate-independent phosphoglycerate mutase (AlkP superfamily)
VTEDQKLKLKPGGALRDIASTLLGVLGQKPPSDMTGTDLRILS